VLKLYFLPFFQEQHKLDTDKLRYFNYGSSKKNPKQLYQPLSEILAKILKKTQHELESLKLKHEKVISSVDSLKKELGDYKDKVQRFQVNTLAFAEIIHHLKSRIPLYKNLSRLKKASGGQVLVSGISSHSEKLEFFRVSTENLILQKTYSLEKQNNEKLNSLATQASFYYNEFYMINQISGEALRGAFYSLSTLKSSEDTEIKILRIFKQLSKSFQEKVEKNESSFGVFSVVFSDKERFIKKSGFVLKNRKEVFKDIRSVKTAVLSYIDNLGAIIKVNCVHKEKIREELEEREKEFEKFIDDYRMTQGILTEYQRTNRKYQELICKRCNKEFIEENNFNWSCTSHTSEFSGEIYWCCGAKSKQSTGCQKRKHEAKTEEEEAEVLKNEEAVEVWFCACCRKGGHSAKDCPSDPNRLTRKFESKALKRRKMSAVNQSMANLVVRSSSESPGFNSSRKASVISKQKDAFLDIELAKAASRTVTPEVSLSRTSSGFFSATRSIGSIKGSLLTHSTQRY
jgi:hypothetical protein